jgi:hypothetical protein
MVVVKKLKVGKPRKGAVPIYDINGRFFILVPYDEIHEVFPVPPRKLYQLEGRLHFMIPYDAILKNVPVKSRKKAATVGKARKQVPPERKVS